VDDGYMKRTEFTLDRVFAATPERLWEAWTEPADLARWIWASLGKEVAAERDLRPGGAYRIYTRFPGGTHRGEGWSGMCGLYFDVAPGERLGFTLHWDADVGYNREGALTLDEVVLVTFAPEGDGTRVVMRHLGIPDDGRSAPTHRAGMAEAFDMLAAVVEA